MNERGERVNVTGSRAAPTGPLTPAPRPRERGNNPLPARAPRTDGAIA
jgi:hypothetical protein